MTYYSNRCEWLAVKWRFEYRPNQQTPGWTRPLVMSGDLLNGWSHTPGVLIERTHTPGVCMCVFVRSINNTHTHQVCVCVLIEHTHTHLVCVCVQLTENPYPMRRWALGFDRNQHHIHHISHIKLSKKMFVFERHFFGRVIIITMTRSLRRTWTLCVLRDGKWRHKCNPEGCVCVCVCVSEVPGIPYPWQRYYQPVSMTTLPTSVQHTHTHTPQVFSSSSSSSEWSHQLD